MSECRFTDLADATQGFHFRGIFSNTDDHDLCFTAGNRGSTDDGLFDRDSALTMTNCEPDGSIFGISDSWDDGVVWNYYPLPLIPSTDNDMDESEIEDQECIDLCKTERDICDGLDNPEDGNQNAVYVARDGGVCVNEPLACIGECDDPTG